MTVFYLQELYKSFCGISAYNTNGRPSTSIMKKNELPPIDIVYPTKDTVLSSRLGAPVMKMII
jgi:tyrosyl-DNA phosphodiesterase-1